MIVSQVVALRKESVDRNQNAKPTKQAQYLSLSARRAWIEIRRAIRPATGRPRSLSARRAWIEIVSRSAYYSPSPVALRKESVDRNQTTTLNRYHFTTSLSARRAWIEIVSRSAYYSPSPSLSARRAWIEMSGHRQAHTSPTSLSARRAWIEIKTGKTHRIYIPSLSARRAWIEMASDPAVPVARRTSLSARRAWIEIASEVVTEPLILVALRKESVDRNHCHLIPNSGTFRRSPQGERG